MVADWEVSVEIRRKGDQNLCKLNRAENGVVYLTFPGLSGTGAVRHLFSTRLGGVSGGIYASMNLSYTRGDEKAAVDENYRRIAACMACGVEDMVCSDQTHTDNIRVVTVNDRGKGVTRPKDYKDVDGLITRERGVVLCTFFADCVPLFFVDPVKKAIGLAHSGWRGTVRKIGKKTVEAMENAFGTNPRDVYAAIGPSICQDCYEVSEDVIEEFRTAFPDVERDVVFPQDGQRGNGEKEDFWAEGSLKKCVSLWYPTKPGKYQLDLWEANRRILLEAGIPKGQIEITDLCTCCNPEFLFSHRASNGKRGNMGAFMGLT